MAPCYKRDLILKRCRVPTLASRKDIVPLLGVLHATCVRAILWQHLKLYTVFYLYFTSQRTHCYELGGGTKSKLQKFSMYFYIGVLFTSVAEDCEHLCSLWACLYKSFIEYCHVAPLSLCKEYSLQSKCSFAVFPLPHSANRESKLHNLK